MTARTLFALLLIPIALILPGEAAAVSCDGPTMPGVLTGCDDATVGELAPALGIDAGDLERVDAARTPSGKVVRLQQEVDGVEVFNGQVALTYDERGNLDMVQAATIPEPDISTTPSVSAADSIAASGFDSATARLVIYPDATRPILAWHVTRASTGNDLNAIVDARTGAVVRSWNAAVEVDAPGSVFDPNPIQTSGNTALTDATSNATLDAQQVPVTLTNLTSAAAVSGDYVDPFFPSNVPPGTYSRSDLQSRFEVVNVYYSITEAQKKIQSLGFTDVREEPIPVTINVTPADNSSYTPATEMLDFGSGGVDDAEDAEVVLHEYGHAIQDDQVENFGSGDEQGAMGEGFGDFFAAMITLEKGNAGYQAARRYCVADWDAATYNPVVGNDDGSGCLRWVDGTDEGTGADIGKYSNTPSEVHDDGRYWSAGMTCIFEGLGGNVAARDKILRLVIDSQQSLVAISDNTAFEKHIAAMIVSDQNLYGGADVTLIRTCADQRGLATLAETNPGDSSPPQVTAVVDPATPDGADGAYSGTVKVTWTVVDNESPATKSGCDPVTIASDTPAAGTTLTCTATSAGGMTSKSVTIKRRAGAALETTITKHPPKSTRRHRARFKFTSTANGSTFECGLDGKRFKKCSSPKKIRVGTGDHTFAVRATDAAGNVEDEPATFKWTVKPRKHRRG